MNNIDTTIPYTIGGLINGQTYQVQMKALNADGNGTASVSQSATPSTIASAPTINYIIGGNNETAFVYFNGTDYVKVVGTATAGAAGGSTTQVQYNNAGVLAGITGATTNGTALTLVAPVGSTFFTTLN